ncbi:hypothetical protein [Planococcus beigongshangi]|uniref:hypothetical protein n=1 Tax=Planococcus beigongshangi TaxID=2782536 RepID=UPI00193C2546|nr:hypothetical protein [Planococcus beigongshangi]
MKQVHPYEEYIKQLEKKYNKSAKELIYHYYINLNEGPSVTARELDIPRKAVLHFIYEYELRQLKHQNVKRNATM